MQEKWSKNRAMLKGNLLAPVAVFPVWSDEVFAFLGAYLKTNVVAKLVKSPWNIEQVA